MGHSSCKRGRCCASVAGKPVEEIVGCPFLCSRGNFVFPTSLMELQVIQLPLLERKHRLAVLDKGEVCFNWRYFAVSRLNQRELLVCAGQELCVWRREQPCG